MNDLIFISIASYRDPELLPTIRDCIKRADEPENLRFCIAWQHSPTDIWDTLEEYVTDSRFNILDISYDTSYGTCWARNTIQNLYNGEKYYMQLDSHHRFVKGWDTKCKKMIDDLQEAGHPKPLLTAYLPSYNPDNDPQERVKDVWKLNFDRFTPEGVIFMLPATMDGWQNETLPVPTRFFSAHFVFTLGQFANEVPYDPLLYFHGEEITLAVRAYTHGYDLFIPNQIVAYHEYTRKSRTKHWDDNKFWEGLNVESLRRCKGLLGIDGAFLEGREHWFGTERTKEDYEKYAGIRFFDRAVSTYTLNHNVPPNPTYSNNDTYNANMLNRFRHCIDVYKASVPDEDWDGWVCSFELDDGTVLHREDVYKEEIYQLKTVEGDWYNLWRQYDSIVPPGGKLTLPDKAIVWPYKEGGIWGPRLEIKVNKV